MEEEKSWGHFFPSLSLLWASKAPARQLPLHCSNLISPPYPFSPSDGNSFLLLLQEPEYLHVSSSPRGRVSLHPTLILNLVEISVNSPFNESLLLKYLSGSWFLLGQTDVLKDIVEYQRTQIFCFLCNRAWIFQILYLNF